MHVTRLFRFLPTVTVAVGSLLVGVTSATSPAIAATPQHGTRLNLKIVYTPAVSLARTAKAGLADGAVPANQPQGFELVQPEDNGKVFCLDAVTVGARAGKNGDAVVLYDCSGNSNQYWYEGPSPSGDPGFHPLHSTKYPNLCLNADDTGGLQNGDVVQLWGCNTANNELWDMGYFVLCTGMLAGTAACPLKLDASYNNIALVLDALDAAPNSGDLKNGDQILIWTYSSAANRNWLPGPGPL